MEKIQDIIIAFGYLGIAGVVFAESGFLLGLFLPGDSLLFTVGLLASQGFFNIWILIPLAIIAAILGDSFGYYCGRKFGPKIFSRENSIFFNKKYVTQTEAFYAKYGKKTIILARFVPIVRTIAPIFAGVGNMHYPTFISFNIIGGIVWAGGLLGISYFLGSIFPGTERYLSYIIAGIIIISVVPVVKEFLKKKQAT